MKRKFLDFALVSALLFSSTLFFGSCQHDDPSHNENTESETNPLQPSGPTLDFEVPAYTLLECTESSASEIAERFEVLPFDLPGMSQTFDLSMLSKIFLSRDAKITSEMRALSGIEVTTVYKEAVLAYTSVDHQGKPVQLSGRISWQEWKAPDGNPVPKASPEILVIENHYTMTDNASCPSESRTLLDSWSFQLPAMSMACDYQGYGVSADKIHPYLNEELTARQQVDFVKAALHWVITECKNVKLANYHTYNIGYSQGGAVAVAVQHWLEEKEPVLLHTLNLRGTMAGDGPYDLLKTMTFYFERGEVEMPVVMPMIVKGMMASYPDLFEGIAIEDYFRPSFLALGGAPGSLLAMLDSKQYNIVAFMALAMKLTGKTSMAVNDILSDEAMNPESRIYKALVAALERNNVLKGWVPKYPVWFYHCEKDAVVPFCNLDLLSTGIWPADTYRIESVTIPDNHLEGAITFYLKAATMMNAK